MVTYVCEIVSKELNFSPRTKQHPLSQILLLLVALCLLLAGQMMLVLGIPVMEQVIFQTPILTQILVLGPQISPSDWDNRTNANSTVVNSENQQTALPGANRMTHTYVVNTKQCSN